MKEGLADPSVPPPPVAGRALKAAQGPVPPEAPLPAPPARPAPGAEPRRPERAAPGCLHTKAATRAAPPGQEPPPRRQPPGQSSRHIPGRAAAAEVGAAASAGPGWAALGRPGRGAARGEGHVAMLERAGRPADPMPEDRCLSSRSFPGKWLRQGGGETGPGARRPREHPSGLPSLSARGADLGGQADPGGDRGCRDGGTSSVQRGRVVPALRRGLV